MLTPASPRPSISFNLLMKGNSICCEEPPTKTFFLSNIFSCHAVLTCVNQIICYFLTSQAVQKTPQVMCIKELNTLPVILDVSKPGCETICNLNNITFCNDRNRVKLFQIIQHKFRILPSTVDKTFCFPWLC